LIALLIALFIALLIALLIAECLKQEISLMCLVGRQGITLKKHGKDYVGLCPFHDDREPSLVISPEKNLWHCPRACREGGDVINWMMKYQGINFRHAVELLREGDFSALSTQLVKRSTVSKRPAPLDVSAEDRAHGLCAPMASWAGQLPRFHVGHGSA